VNARAQCRQAEQQQVSPLLCFVARAEARALLFRCCEFSLHEAVDPLRQAALDDGLIDEVGEDAIQHILANAFRAVRNEQ
jgi:hypothetical protein